MTSSPAFDDLPVSQGEIFAGEYRIERVLGEGGMAFVVAARSEKTGELVAIKLLRPELHRYEVMAARFVREARAAGRISSEFVPRIYDVGTTESGQAYMVMELLEGKNLEEVLLERGRLPIAEAVDYVMEALEAVAEAHALGIIHRDLKPANLFMTRLPGGHKVLKVLDFGISKLGAEDSPELTRASTMVGSSYYMSPEQMNGLRELDGRSDLWSLGVTAYELLTGSLPFGGTSTSEVCSQVLYEPAKSPLLLRPELSPALCEVVLRCLSKDREDRPADADALAGALLRSLPAQATTSPFMRRGAR